MAYLGTIRGNCGTERAYTGRTDCQVKEGRTVGLIITGANARYPSDPEEFISGLVGWGNSTGADHMTFVKEVNSSEPTGGDLATSDAGGRGIVAPIGENQTIVPYQFKGDTCLYKELGKFDLQYVRLFRIDENFNVWGTAIKVGDVVYFVGYDTQRMSILSTPGDTTSELIGLTAYYQANYRSEKKARNMIAVGDGNIPDGLLGVVLEAGATAGTARVIHPCSGSDYTNMKWAEADAYVTEAGTNPTTVTFDPATRYLTFAPAGAYKIVDAEELSTLGLEGVEGLDEYTQIGA